MCWFNDVIYITFVVISCPGLVRAPNAASWKCRASKGFKMNEVGTQCITVCNRGYVLKEGTSSNRLCEKDGSWTGKPLECERKL